MVAKGFYISRTEALKNVERHIDNQGLKATIGVCWPQTGHHRNPGCMELLPEDQY
jgi:hypothetical protein